ncbi:MAG: sugar phosphate isomerase/epimerase [Clostridia bacterium]|nr:sugar phosphate isomerase/epimerase [Clostridia bacterium]
MTNEVFLSTGAFVGRINNRDYTLISRFADKIEADGFEFMIYEPWYPQLNSIIDHLKDHGVKIRVIHGDKHLGDLMSEPDQDSWNECMKLFERNLSAANRAGAEKIVAHIWGRPNSDNHAQIIYNRVGKLMEKAKEYSVDLVSENCVCFTDPLTHLEKLADMYPDFGFTFDTRPAQFHSQLKETVQSRVFSKNMRHIHINDYRGGHMQWDALYPIYQPGLGDIDFDFFFENLRAIDYNGTITLEAPSMKEDTVDFETFNKSIRYIKDSLNK